MVGSREVLRSILIRHKDYEILYDHSYRALGFDFVSLSCRMFGLPILLKPVQLPTRAEKLTSWIFGMEVLGFGEVV